MTNRWEPPRLKHKSEYQWRFSIPSSAISERAVFSSRCAQNLLVDRSYANTLSRREENVLSTDDPSFVIEVKGLSEAFPLVRLVYHSISNVHHVDDDDDGE